VIVVRVFAVINVQQKNKTFFYQMLFRLTVLAVFWTTSFPTQWRELWHKKPTACSKHL